jgi:hypothetical protein
MDNWLLRLLITGNQIFEAGIAITACSLFLRSLTFNLRDRVTRTFALILLCIGVIFAGEALSGVVKQDDLYYDWLKFYWIGILFLPATYINFADALLETTGRPSRGRRRLLVRFSYGVSVVFLVALFQSLLISDVSRSGSNPIPLLERTYLSWIFTGYYFVLIVLAISVIWRAYIRTVLTASKRRFGYLLVGSGALAVGSYPYLLLGSGVATQHPIVFFLVAVGGNLLAYFALVMMAYAVAFFGVAWPDRVVKTRLLKWMLRGPVTVFVVLIVMTFVWQGGELLGFSYSVAIPVVTVITVLVMQHFITLGVPFLEHWLPSLFGGDREIQTLSVFEERLITSGDMRQLLEAVLAAVCDQFQTDEAFIVGLEGNIVNLFVPVGEVEELAANDVLQTFTQDAEKLDGNSGVINWRDYWLLPLHARENDELIGVLGVTQHGIKILNEDALQALILLGDRAAMVIEDYMMQQQVFQAVKTLSPKVELIQRLRAASRFNRQEVMTDLDEFLDEADMARFVKDAFSHYWGGPKLTQNPLMELEIVQQAVREHDGNPTKAMRDVLQKGLDSIRPEGDRRFTGEWILYNILDMKFLQGKKVRDVAMRLAMSEADLYRKQRVALEAVANAIIEMERSAREGVELQEDLVNYEAKQVSKN